MSFSHRGITLGIPHLRAENQLLELSFTSPVFAYSAHEDDTGLLYQDAAKSVAASSNNDPVYTAVQVSGFGAVDGVQATLANRPWLKTGANGINNHNALSFDGGDFLVLTGITASSGAKTFYIVTKPSVATGTNMYVFDTATGRLILGHLTNVDGKTGFFDGSWKVNANATTDAQILCFALGSGTGTIYRNGVSIGSAAYTNQAIGGNVSLGAHNNGLSAYFNGLIGAIYCDNSLQDAATISNNFTVLGDKWGITVS